MHCKCSVAGTCNKSLFFTHEMDFGTWIMEWNFKHGLWNGTLNIGAWNLEYRIELGTWNRT